MSLWMIAAVPVICWLALGAGLSRAAGEYGWMVAQLVIAICWAVVFYRELQLFLLKRKKRRDHQSR